MPYLFTKWSGVSYEVLLEKKKKKKKKGNLTKLVAIKTRRPYLFLDDL